MFPAPMHDLSLVSDLVNGEVQMGECTELLFDSIDIILGNKLAGAGVGFLLK